MPDGAGPQLGATDSMANSEHGRRFLVSPFLLQLLTAGLTVMAAHAVRPMVTYRAIGLGAGPIEIGLVQSAFSVLPLLTAIAIGRWVDRVGEARVVALGSGLIGVGALAAAFSPTLIVLGIGQLFTGFGLIAAAIALQAMVANRGPLEGRVQRFGWYAVAVSLGQFAGPAVGTTLVVATSGPAGEAIAGSLSPQAPAFLFASVAAFLAVGAGLALPYRGSGRPVSPEQAPGMLAAASTVLQRPGMGAAMFVSIAVTASVDVLIAYLPAYGAASGIGITTIGALLSVRAGASVVSRMFMARLSALIGIDRLLFASAASAAVGIFLLPFIRDIELLFVLMVFIGLGLGVGQPMTVAWVAQQSRPEERGLALGVRLTGNLAAMLIMPTAMGVIAGASGVSAIWVVLAALLGLGAAVAWRTPFDVIVGEPDRESSEPGV